MKNKKNISIYKKNNCLIYITKNADEQIKKLLKKKYIGIQINIKKSGCAGFKYYLKKISKIESQNITLNTVNFVVCIPKKKFKIINGLEIDYEIEGINQIFKFKHPKIEDFCGCGKSFTIKEK